MTDSQPSRAFRFKIAAQLIAKSSTMRPMPMACFGEEAAQRVHVGGHALDQVAGRRAAVIREAQALDVVEQEVAQAARDAFGRVGRQATGEEREGALDERQADETAARSRAACAESVPPT